MRVEVAQWSWGDVGFSIHFMCPAAPIEHNVCVFLRLGIPGKQQLVYMCVFRCPDVPGEQDVTGLCQFLNGSY